MRPSHVIFTGHSELTIDAKQRLAVPSKYRAQLEQNAEPPALYCMPWDGHGLMLFPESVFKELADRQGKRMFPVGDGAELQTDMFGLTERLEWDSAGRIAIPRFLTELVGLKSDVVVIGARYRLDVKDRAAWMQGLKDRFQRYSRQGETLGGGGGDAGPMPSPPPRLAT
jgi:MraZ protein